MAFATQEKSTSHSIQWAITLVFLGCCFNVITLEFIVRAIPGSGQLVTFAQFLFVALDGLTSQYEYPFGLKRRAIPLKFYISLTAIFALQSILGNEALNYDISIPLHTIFRSSSLAASLVIGFIFFQKSYTLMQILSCLLVMIGIILATLADAQGKGQTFECCNSLQSLDFSWLWSSIVSGSLIQNSSAWFLGILILTAALFLSALLGHMQEYGYRRYGKVWQENLFYSHALALPGFWRFRNEIITTSTALYNHAGVTVFGYTVPLTVFLLTNMISQSVCIRGVFMLTSASDTLTTTLTITLRKFMSLIFSVLYFQNPFTGLHWIGSVLVFVGAAVYSLFPGKKKSDNENIDKQHENINHQINNGSSSKSNGTDSRKSNNHDIHRRKHQNGNQDKK